MANPFAVQAPFLEWGVAVRALPTERKSGDVHVVRPFVGGGLVAVVDGLGHGEEAATAARLAAATLAHHAGDSVIALVRRCHEALARTRGAVMTLGAFNTADATLTWTGVGNVEGVLVRAAPDASNPRERVVLRGGVVGYELPLVRATVVPVLRGDMLVLATDGIRMDFVDWVNVREPPQRLADHLLAEFGKDDDDALVLVARYINPRP